MERDDTDSSALHLSPCWMFCVSDLSSYQRAVSHADIRVSPKVLNELFFSVSSKNSVVVEEGSSMFSRDFAASFFDLKMTKFILIGGQVFPWSVCSFMASKTFE